MTECTNEDRADWAAIALTAYTEQAPASLFPAPDRAERVRLGVVAAEAMARTVFRNPVEQVVDGEESAERVIGDLITYVFCLADEQASPDALTRAAEELRSTAYPVTLAALCEVAAAEAERVAAMLAALFEAAEAFGCDVPAMIDSSREWFELLKEAEEAEEADNAVSM
ncbi:hypothetical protein ABZ508_35455 [Streptomyces lavendulocolor]|uniref:Uncharacterized protein n=1 Tax=Streptomyces lavendulocolor TaxID=67316 RepID=A0ABV2WH26_9ACTN